jgi:glycosyltransferase involved in cell wall biosynthesis
MQRSLPRCSPPAVRPPHIGWMIGLLHRHVWQRLPYRWRRATLFRAASLLAPRPLPGARPGLPPIVAGTLRTASGLGQSARLCRDALAAAGVPVASLDLTGPLRQPSDLPAPPARQEPPPGLGTLILHVNAPLTGLALAALGRRRVVGRRVVGYWAWELPDVPEEWRLGVPLVHEIWVPSRFTAAALRRIAGDRPVHVVPHPVALGPVPRPAPPAGGPFTVLTIFDAGSSLARKNPEGAVTAFRRAFGEAPEARLVVKASRLDTLPPDQAGRLRGLCAAPNIVLIEEVLDPAGLDALYGQADVLLSLHRSEGFGLTMAEAMRRGVPVVATGWSGNADFLTPEVGVPVPWRLVPAVDPQRTYDFPEMSWAEPDLDAAAAALRRLREDPAGRARLGDAARALAAERWSAEAYRARLAALGVPV